MASGEDDEFEIVVICSGNRFRSPLVAAYLRQATKGLPVRVGSAGTLDLGALPPLEGALRAARELGLDLSGHSSRFVGNVPLAAAELVLGFERMHVTTAVVDGGAQRERVFTLPELVSVLEHSQPPRAVHPIERARQAIALANDARGSSSGLRLPEIDDPIRMNASAQHDTALELIDLSSRLVAELFGLPVARPNRRSRAGRFRRRG
jgi:protein-tyrosine phosphatase